MPEMLSDGKPSYCPKKLDPRWDDFGSSFDNPYIVAKPEYYCDSACPGPQKSFGKVVCGLSLRGQLAERARRVSDTLKPSNS